MSYPVSLWYNSLGNCAFPTVFIRLKPDEKEAFLAGDRQSRAGRELIAKMDYVIEHLPGACFVHADACAPTDAPDFGLTDGSVKQGRAAWAMLQGSKKVRTAIEDGRSERIAFHPFRRMDHSREFRLFVNQGQLRGMSQRYLRKHHPRLEKRAREIWRLGEFLIADIAGFLPADDIVIDTYLTATARLMILDLNMWGAPTDPLLFRDWDQDWSQTFGLRLLPKPMRLGGDVSVRF